MIENDYYILNTGPFTNREPISETIHLYQSQQQQETFGPQSSLVNHEMYQQAPEHNFNSNSFPQGDEFSLFIRIKNELIPHWEELSFESLSSCIDNFIAIIKQKINLNEIIKNLEEQYNNEIRNFNYILEQYDFKFKDVFNKVNTIININNNSKKQNQAYLFLKTQVNTLLNEQQHNIKYINSLKSENIKLQTEIQLKEVNNIGVPFNTDLTGKIKDNMLIDKLNRKIDYLMKELKTKENYKNNNANEHLVCSSSEGNERVYNNCLVNVMKNIKEKNKELEILNKKINKLTEKHVIDANSICQNVSHQRKTSVINGNSIDKINKSSRNMSMDIRTNILQEHSTDTSKFEEILKLKNNISGQNK